MPFGFHTHEENTTWRPYHERYDMLGDHGARNTLVGDHGATNTPRGATNSLVDATNTLVGATNTCQRARGLLLAPV